MMEKDMKRTVIVIALAAGLLLAACGSDGDSGGEATDAPTSDSTPGTTASTEAVPEATDPVDDTTGSSTTPATDAAGATTLRVPDDHPTIQAAVDAAAPGSLVLVSPGVYHEAVDVTTDELTIRGLDRDGVVLDGQFELDNGIRVLGATGVAIENMTAQNYTNNGFFWTSATGYRGSYLTTYRTGDYGVYAFDSVGGLLEHSYMAGSPDAGIYIGQCYPCDAVIDQVVSEHNGLGYSGTNSGGNLLIVNSTFRNNRAGVVPNSGSYELCYPERATTIVGNLVYSNNQPDTPAIDVALLAMGNGILVPGGVRNVIERNLVWDHDKTGIGLVPFLEEDPNDDMPTEEEWDTSCAVAKDEPVAAQIPDSLLWDAYDNIVRGNVLSDNRTADLGVGSAGGDLSTFGNCWSGNSFSTSRPAGLETLAPCDGDVVTGDGWTIDPLDVVSWLAELDSRPPSVDWKTAPLPPLEDQAEMPDAATAPARPATDVPPAIDLAAIAVPTKPAS
jgi:hypothetical protein